MIVPVVYPLLMTSEGQTPVTVTVPGVFDWYVGPVTAATMQLNLDRGPHAHAAYAFFRVMSTVQAANTVLFRLVSADDGPSNLVQLVTLTNTRPGSGNISNDGVWWTDELNAIVTAGVRKNIGWQMAGDNTHPVTVWNVRLEVGWDITGDGWTPTPAGQDITVTINGVMPPSVTLAVSST